MTEFDERLVPTGREELDHGTAGAGFVLGPQLYVRVVSDWPGLGKRAL